MTAALRTPFNLSAHLRPTVGDQKMSYVGVDHMGWMLCDGRSLSRDTHALLFGVIGTTFGADDSSTFKLPDFRGMVPGMAGQPQFSNAANPTTYAIGDRTGEQQHRLNIDEMPAHTHGASNVTSNNNGSSYTGISGEHTHTINDPGHAHSYFNQANDQSVFPGVGETAADQAGTPQTTGSNTTGITINPNGNHAHFIGSTGGSNWHNNMQPTLFAGNMFMYSGKTMQAYFPYTWVGGIPASDATVPTPGAVSIF